jgi:predicted MFS family arabinose efflux permease
VRRDALPAYLTTATLSRSATEAAGPALLVTTIAIVGSATTGSYIAASLSASAALAGPFVGALIDRAEYPRRGFTVSIAIMAIGLTLVALTIGSLPVAWVMLLAFIAGIGYPALTGAWTAQLPALVAPERLPRAYSADAATYSVAAVVAPPLATALVVVSPTAPLWVPIGLLVVCIVVLRIVPLPHRAGHQPHTNLAQDLRAGVATLVGRPALRRTMLITTIGFAGTAALFVAAPILAQDATGSLGFTGVILGVFSVGGLLSALWFTRHPPTRPDLTVAVTMALSGMFLLGVGLAPTTWLMLAMAFAMGATEPPMFGAMFRVRARESSPEVQAQVFTTSASLRTTAFALGTALFGWLLHWGLPAVIVVGVALHAVSLVVGIAFGPPLPPRGRWRRQP